MATTAKISRRSRNIGYGWTNSVTQDGGHLRVEEPTEDVRGGPRTVLQERADAMRINNGNDWRGAWFVGGRRVVHVIDPHYMQVRDIGRFLQGKYMFGDVEELTVAISEEVA